jgi:hypothetical protein
MFSGEKSPKTRRAFSMKSSSKINKVFPPKFNFQIAVTRSASKKKMKPPIPGIGAQHVHRYVGQLAIPTVYIVTFIKKIIRL